MTIESVGTIYLGSEPILTNLGVSLFLEKNSRGKTWSGRLEAGRHATILSLFKSDEKAKLVLKNGMHGEISITRPANGEFQGTGELYNADGTLFDW